MRHLFSTFARGWPGIGLLILRMVAGTFLIFGGAEKCHAAQILPLTILGVLSMVGGTLLVAGLWTPIAGPLLVALSTWDMLTRHDNQHSAILLAAIGAALALMGPGAISIDARLFGWKRVDLDS